MFTTRQKLHLRIRNFVDWIRTDSEKEGIIRKQANEIRERVKSQASNDGLIILLTPWSGSFEKRTGLRRHLRGLNPVEGQDVDLPFVISPKTKDDEELSELLQRFDKYLEQSYPNTPRNPTKSSVKLNFVGTKIAYDIVPMLATKELERQIIIRGDGTRRETSVQKHIEFIKTRTKNSEEQKGRVSFNEMVRLFKWWREVKCGGDNDSYPTILIDLLSAYAYDRVGVCNTYTETLAQWFSFLADVVEQRTSIYFSDFIKSTQRPSGEVWSVVDPVNTENNIAGYLGNAEISVLSEWLSQARDDVLQAIAADNDDDESAAIDALIPVFGTPILYNS
jgi:Second Messenger Oligonucleotide or Dinucleotide Synthetase domain